MQKRWIPLTTLLCLFSVFFYFQLDQYLNFNFLHNCRVELLTWTHEHPLLAALSFIGIYISTIAIAIPSALILTLTSGFLFGSWGAIYVIISATIGASLLFFAVKIALSNWLSAKTSQWLVLMKEGFQQNAFSYLLTLRLIPIFPFFLVNIVSGLLNIKTKTFILATLIGITPGTLIYVMIGNNLGRLFDQNQKPPLDIILSPSIVLSLMGLACLSLLPVFYQRYNKNKVQDQGKISANN